MQRILVSLLALIPLFTQAQEGTWTPEDIITTEYVYSPDFSEDGTKVIWSKRTANKEKDKFHSSLFLTMLNITDESGLPTTVQLTSDKYSDQNPVFSANGQTVYFLSDRDEGKKLWSLSLHGGEAKEVHTFDNGISDIQRAGNLIYFSANDGKTLFETRNEKDNSIVVEDTAHWKASKVYAFNLEEKTISRITDNENPITGYTISRDGKWMIAIEAQSRSYAADARIKPHVYLYNLASGESIRILEGLQQPGGFRFDPENKGFYFTNEYSSDPEWDGSGITQLNYYTLASNSYIQLPLDWENGVGGGFSVMKDGVFVQLADGPYYQLAYYNMNDGWAKNDVEAAEINGHITLLGSHPATGALLYRYSTASSLPEYFIEQPSVRKNPNLSAETTFVELNKKLEKKSITQSEVIRWIGANGDEVNGILYYPSNYKNGEKYPLILSIHGGPSGWDMDQWSERWSTYPQIFAQKGAFVLKPNYHGSGNHGLKFVESIKMHYYDLEMVDIMNGITYLDSLGYIDSDKLGVMGWSNGAILATMLTVRYPDTFKAAAPGAGDVNWTSDFGTCQFGVSFDQSYFGGAPWDNVGGNNFNPAYIEKSPLFELEKVTTPTIIFHGSEDRSVPRDQGWEYYRALQQIAKAPVKFLWFPGQPHGLQKITHQTRKMKEEIAWFDRYLFNNKDQKNESFKTDSPIAAALQKDSLASSNGTLGVITGEYLLPEFTEYENGKSSISKYEITNAQYAASNPAFSYENGKGNYPVTGLSSEQVLNYLSWLNSTGETYRLPTRSEAAALHKSARKGAKEQNNLNYWAGYEISWDDVRDFRKKMDQVQHSLVEAVDERKPLKHGEQWIYGLGGNVAEYYQEEESMAVYDYSAYDYVDPAESTLPLESREIGLRIMRAN